MRREWGCDCGDKEAAECPMHLISLLQRYGANWTPRGAYYENVPKAYSSWHSDYSSVQGTWPGSAQYRCKGRGAADLIRLTPYRLDKLLLRLADDGPVLIKPSVGGAMYEALLGNTAYKRDHCLPFLAAILESGIAAEDLSSAIVGVLLEGGTDAGEPGAMQTAVRLACLHATKDAEVAFVTLLLEHGAESRVAELQDEIQGAAEKWWVQSAWQSMGVFRRILDLLAEGGLDVPVAEEILAVLSLNHNPLAGEAGDSVEV
ncbi:hypothetical protein UCDDA912_g04909 [Diaporthe ampelina]|uniref:Uncharacterized protein n=1 Tax=Diaporthe ampelina TaxID=1214573 RepID=A0A0G2FM48_9PEZI|nr:hypothetical protein UCDDA912_g04909 [Diaporthe ampelina]